METPPVQVVHDVRNEPTPEFSQPLSSSQGLFRTTLALIGVLLLALFFSVTASARDSDKNTQVAAVAEQNPSTFTDLQLTAKAAIVADLTTGTVLFSKNADTQLPLASITKVPMILAVSEVLGENEEVPVSADAVARGEGGQVWSGEIWRARDLMDLTLVASSNVGAEALAEKAEPQLHARYPKARGENAVTWRMNNIASQLGLSQTYFLNPTGLDVSATQAGAAGSARDIATLFAYVARTIPELFTATATSDLSLSPENAGAKSVHNTNEALPDIPGLIFGKTGYTDLAGGNLAVVFDVGPSRPFVAVILGSTYEGRFDDMRALVERTRKALSGGAVPLSIHD